MLLPRRNRNLKKWRLNLYLKEIEIFPTWADPGPTVAAVTYCSWKIEQLL